MSSERWFKVQGSKFKVQGSKKLKRSISGILKHEAGDRRNTASMLPQDTPVLQFHCLEL
jgi:hypothetical protein